MGTIDSAFVHPGQIKKMVTKKTRIFCTLLLFNNLISNAFETDKCDHGNLTAALGKLISCLDTRTDPEDDICVQFEKTGECAASILENCFDEENILKITKEVLADLRDVKTGWMLDPDIQNDLGLILLSEAEVDSLFSACPNIPDKTFAENQNKTFFALDLEAVRTDDNCTNEEIIDVNVESLRCIESEMENLDLERTVGNCLKKTFPSCFSMRERSFLRSNLSDQIHVLLKKLADLAKSVWPEVEQISFSNCSVFSGSTAISNTWWTNGSSNTWWT